MAPAASVVFGVAFIILYAGVSSPFAMLVGTVGAMLIAVCIGQLARHITSAGGIYAYAATVFGDSAGFLVGWIYNVLYLMIICLVALSISLTGSDFLKFYVHVNAPLWLLSIGLIGFSYLMTLFGIRPSTAITVTLAVIEVVLLLAIAGLLISKGGHANSLSYFNPAHAAGAAKGTARALFLGVVFAFASIAGFEAAVPLAEETKSPRRNIPKAVVGSVGVIGLFYVIATYAAVVGWGPSRLSSMIKSDNPWREMSAHVGGGWAFLVALAILNSQIAATIACFNASSRLFYAASRNRVLPAAVSRVHPRWRTPHIAAALTAMLAVIGVFATRAVFHGVHPAYAFFLTINTVIFLIVYVVVCVATTVFYATTMRREFKPVVHVVVPLVALCALGPALYYSLKGLTYPASAAIPCVAVWILVGVFALAVLRLRRVDISDEGQRWLEKDSAPASH